MKRKFAVFILSNRRPNRVVTHKVLRAGNYTGKIFVIVDDEDPTLEEYRKNFGDEVIVFSKKAMASQVDTFDRNPNDGIVLYARNASFEIARKLGLTHFIQLDDDYGSFFYRRDESLAYRATPIKNFDDLFPELFDFLDSTPFGVVTMSQGGDHIGGATATHNAKGPALTRKAMNSFFCSLAKPFRFIGRLNEDVNVYTALQRAGFACATIMQVQLNQVATQANDGGLTPIYLSVGTYVKSFYSVICCPSAVKIGVLGDNARTAHYRIHHAVDWDAVAPKIVRESLKKPPAV